MTEEEFRTELAARGYGDPRSYSFEPNADGELHSHEFSAMAGVGGEVSAGTLHSENAGPVGATLLVGTK